MNGTIWINQVPTTVKSAEFGIWIDASYFSMKKDKPADPVIGYFINIEVDDESYDDGAAAPFAQKIPVWEAAGGRTPTLLELGQLKVRTPGDWEAFFGIDAPSLDNNEIQFGGWRTPTCLRVRWESTYDDYIADPKKRKRAGTVVYEGELVFTGIDTAAANPAEADALVRSIWGAEQFEKFDRIDTEQTFLPHWLQNWSLTWLAKLPGMDKRLRKRSWWLKYIPKSAPAK